DAHARGRRARVADDVTQSPHRLTNGAETRLARIRPGLAESRDADHDETRIALRELLIAATPLLHCAGTAVLEQKVRARSEIAQQLLPCRPPEIQGDRFLVARDHRPPERLAMRLLAAPLPHRVALPGRLDLYDLGAHVAEQLT